MNYYELLGGIVDFVNEIKFENRFHLETNNVVQKIYEYFKENNLTVLKKGTPVFRARIDFDPHAKIEGFPLEEMGAPPTHIAGEGRINPVGMGCLYCAKELETAIAELRPWASAYVTVAEGVVLNDCEIIAFHKNIFNESIDLKNHKHLFELSVNSLFSGRQSPQNRTGYLPSQYLSEYFKRDKLDGVSYSSSLSKKGTNIALFEPSKVNFTRTEVFSIADVEYKLFNLTQKREHDES